jgi:hypothetical protein
MAQRYYPSLFEVLRGLAPDAACCMSEQTRRLGRRADDVILSTYQSTKSYRAAAKKLECAYLTLFWEAAYLTSTFRTRRLGRPALRGAQTPNRRVR